MAALLVFALVAGQILLGARPQWASYALFLALLPAYAGTLTDRPATLTTTRRGWWLLALGATAVALVWVLPTLRARGWTLVAIALLALTVTIDVAADRRRRQRLALALVLLGALQTGFGLTQASAGLDVLGAEFREAGRIATGTFTNRNHLAGFLNMTLPLAVGLLYIGYARRRRRRSERWAWSWLLLLVGGFIGLGVLLTRSRAGTVTLFLTVLFLGALLIARGGGRRRGLPVTAAWVLLAVITVLGLTVGLDSLITRFTEITSDARPLIFAGTLGLIADHWLLGVGAGMYRWAFRPYQTADLEHWYTHAHNDYLETAADFGLPLAALLWGFIFWRLYRAGRLAVTARRSATRGMALGAAGAIFSIAVHSLVDFNLHIPANLAVFSVVIGIAWSLEPAAKPARPAAVRWPAVACLALLVLSLLAGWSTTRRFAAETLTLWPRGTPDLELAVARRSDTPEAHLALGRRLRDSPGERDLERAVFHLERAATLNQRSWQSHWELALLFELAGRDAEAANAFANAIEHNPRDGRYRWRFANFLVRQGTIEPALPQVRAALEAAPRLWEPAWNLLASLELSDAQLDRAWPDDPAARLALLRRATRQPETAHAAFLNAQWAAVLASTTPPSAEEGAFFPAWLLARGEDPEARRQWIALLAANDRDEPAYNRGDNVIWNGEFTRPPLDAPLDWRFARGAGFTTARVPGSGPDGTAALRLQFDGQENLDRVLVTQLVLVEPGVPYRLSYRTRSADLTSDQGPALEIVTLPARRELFRDEMVLGDTPWQNHVHLVTPPDDSHRIEVRLRRRPSLRLDAKIGGTLWVDSVRLERLEVE